MTSLRNPTISSSIPSRNGVKRTSGNDGSWRYGSCRSASHRRDSRSLVRYSRDEMSRFDMILWTKVMKDHRDQILGIISIDLLECFGSERIAESAEEICHVMAIMHPPLTMIYLIQILLALTLLQLVISQDVGPEPWGESIMHGSPPKLKYPCSSSRQIRTLARPRLLWNHRLLKTPSSPLSGRTRSVLRHCHPRHAV